jgi:concanavalin A-like lectin/glucanase superfamily protein
MDPVRRAGLAVGTVAALAVSTSTCSGDSQGPGPSRGNFALRFFGNGENDIDRVKIPIDNPSNSNPGPPADVGATDFTIEFWMRANAADNLASAVTCGPNINWIFGNIIIDRDRYSQDRKFGLSMAGGQIVFGVSGNGTGNLTICGTSRVDDGVWHHIAVTRSLVTGALRLFVDGVLQATAASGPGGDISYPDDGVPGDFCNGPCTNSDPYLVIGAEKHDAGPPAFNGFVDELRLSTVLRYSVSFVRPRRRFAPDPNTAALYHFDEGLGDQILDSSGASGGPSHGVRRVGGVTAGPLWVTSDAPTGST